MRSFPFFGFGVVAFFGVPTAFSQRRAHQPLLPGLEHDRFLTDRITRSNVSSGRAKLGEAVSSCFCRSRSSPPTVHAMTMSLAAEWGRYGIRLNGIAPGEIPTEGMNRRLTPTEKTGERTAAVNPMGRAGTTEELQNLAAFVLSDGCRCLSGETIAVDGAQALAHGRKTTTICATGPTRSGPRRGTRSRR